MEDESEGLGGEGGFTLIEVAVALVILALALGVVFNLISDGLGRTRETEQDQAAEGVAYSVLQAALNAPPAPSGDSTGDIDNHYTWRVHRQDFGNRQDRDAWPVGAQDLTVTVSWIDRGRQKSVSLRTMQLVPKSK